MTEPVPMRNFDGENIIRYDVIQQAAHPPMGKGLRSLSPPSPPGSDHQAPNRS